MWTKEHAAEAALRGWGIFDVVEGKQVFTRALPFEFTALMPNVHTLMQAVIAGARTRDTLCLCALRHIATSNTPRQ